MELTVGALIQEKKIEVKRVDNGNIGFHYPEMSTIPKIYVAKVYLSN